MASAAGVYIDPNIISGTTDDNSGTTDDYVHCTHPSGILKLLAHHCSAVFCEEKDNTFLSWGLLKGYCMHVVWNWNLSQPPDSRTIDAAIMNSRTSSPGIDNIGNLVWKFSPPQFRSYLYNCLNSHLSRAPPFSFQRRTVGLPAKRGTGGRRFRRSRLCGEAAE